MKLVVAQSLSCVRLFVTSWTAARQASLSFTISQSLFNLMYIELVMPFQSSYPLSVPSPPGFSLAQHQGLFSESVPHIWWPKYQSFSFSISPFNAYSGLMSFRSDWFELPAVQGTLKDSSSGPQFKNINSSARTFLMMQITSIYDHWKNHSLD